MLSTLLGKLSEMVPVLKKRVRTVFTDGLGSTDAILDVLPHVKHCRCTWHMLDVDLPRALPAMDQLSLFKAEIFKKLVNSTSAERFDAAWADMKPRYPAKTVQYVEDNWIPEKAKWAGYARLQYRTLGKTANTTAEQTNSVLAGWINGQTLAVHDLFLRLEDKGASR